MVSARGRPNISSPHFAFFILSFIAAAHGIRHSHAFLGECHNGCHGAGGGIGYEEGQRYQYRYEGSSRMRVGGSSKDLAPMDMTAIVYVTPINACNVQIQVNDVKVTSPEAKLLENGIMLTGPSGILAGFDGTGKLMGQICAPLDQSNTFTNLHRAVLSLIQSHVPRNENPSTNATLHQTDVFGVCRTNYSVRLDDYEHHVTSTKDLNSCAHREEALLPILASPYHTKSGFEKTGILSGVQTRKQVFLQRILKEVRTREVYTLAPITDESAASIVITTKLKLTNKQKFMTVPITAFDNYGRRPVFFKAAEAEVGKTTFDEIKKNLLKMSEGKVTSVKETSPREFNAFVRSLAGADKADVLKLMTHVKQGNDFNDRNNARRILLDGLVDIASSTSVEVMTEFVKSGDVKGSLANKWLMSLPHTKSITAEALTAVQGILESKMVPVEAYLGIGALVGKFCRHQDCQKLELVKNIEDLMIKPLLETCKPTNILVENNALAGLKGLGNIRFLSENAVKRLTECALNKDAWMRIRVAAIETMKTDSSKPTIKQTVEKIFRDIREDSELRIKAYLTLVEKPSSKIAEIIKDVLTDEKSHQVGGFIASHLRSVRSSTNPDKEAMRHHLGGVYIRSGKFAWDPKKYSQNFELGYKGDEWSSAGEMNVIYSHRGYLPRSLAFNLTTNLYGHSFNLFEVGLRTEGAERAFENLLKNLALKREPMNDLLKNGTQLVDHITSKLSRTLRSKRSVDKDKINSFHRKMGKQGGEYHDGLLMDLSVKSLGAEVGFYSSVDDEFNPKKSIDQFFNGFKYTVDKTKHMNVEYTKHASFLEGEIIYPTLLGLPLRLKTKGSAAFGLAAEMNLDVPSLLRTPSDLHQMKLKLIPSGSVEMVGSMSLYTGILETGVEVNLAAHSSTGGDVSLKYASGKELEMVLGVPLREQKVISVSTGLSTVVKQNEHITTTPVELDINKVSTEEYSGCFEQLVPATGLTFCGQVSVPNNNLPTLNPLYGPSKFAFSVHVEDDTITYYVFKTSLEDHKILNKRKLRILLDTPGSEVNRKVSIGYESELNLDTKEIKLYFDTFWKSFLIQGSMVKTGSEMSVSGKFKFDENEYASKLGMTLTKSSPTITVYKPFFQYSFPELKTRLISKSNPSDQFLKLSGEVIVERKVSDGMTTFLFNRLTVEVNDSNYTVDGSVSTQVRGDSSTLNADMKVLYDEEYVAVNCTLSRLGTTRLEGNLVFFPSQNPHFAFSIEGRIENVVLQDIKFLAEVNFTHGPNPDDSDLRFTFVNEVTVVRDNALSLFAVKYFVAYPPARLKCLSELEWVPRELKYKLDMTFDETIVDLKLTATTGPSGLLYDVALSIKLMDKGFKVEIKRKLVEEHKSKITNILQIYPELKVFQVNALISHKFGWSDLDASIQSEIKTPFKPGIIRISTGVQNNDNKFMAQYFLEVDTKLYVDFFTERTKGPVTKGNFKLLLTDHVDSKGEYAIQESVLKGSGYILLLKSQHRVDSTVEGTVNHPTYDFTIDSTWTSPGQPKTVRWVYGNTFGQNLFSVMNSLYYEGKLSMLNFYYRVLENDGYKHSFATEFEVQLRQEHNVLIKYAHQLNSVPGDGEGEYSVIMVHKNFSHINLTKVHLNLVTKHVDFEKGKIEALVTGDYFAPNGEIVYLKMNHKKMPKDDKWFINTELNLSGPLIKKTPVSLKLNCELARSLLADSVSWSRVLPPTTYRVVGSIGSNTDLEAFGKITGNTYSGELTLRLPKDYRLNYLKWSSVNMAQFNPEPNNQRQVKTSNLFKWNNLFFEIDNEIILKEDSGSVKFDWEYNTAKKRSLHFSAHWPNWGNGVVDFDTSAKYDKDGNVSDVFFKYSADFVKGEGSLHFRGTCPANGIYDLKIATKRFQEGKGLHTEWVLLAKNKTRKGLYKILHHPDHPYLEYFIQDENNIKSGFLIKADKKGTAEWTGNIHVEWAMEPQKKGYFYVNSDMKFLSLDDFFLNVEANSNKYQLKDWLVEARSFKSLNTVHSRNIAFKIQHDFEVLLNGSAHFNYDQIKDGVYNVEASGKAMFDGSPQPVSLKVTWKPTSPNHGFNGTVEIGDTNVRVESVFDDSNIYFVRRFCSPRLKKKCSEASVIWNSAQTDGDDEDQRLEIMLDLSSMNPTMNDFILNMNVKWNPDIIDQKVELQWIKDKPLIYKGYIYQDKAGLTIGLPKRTIAGDVVFQFHHDGHHKQLYLEANLWLNKLNEPDIKTHLLLSSEISRDIDLYTCTTEMKLSHPSLQKDYGVKGKATAAKSWSNPKSDGHFEFDVFKSKEDAITLTWNMGNIDEKSSYNAHNAINAKSKGLKMDVGYDRRVAITKMSISWIDSVYYTDDKGQKRESWVKVDIKPKKFLLSFKLPDVPMYDVNFNLEKKDNRISLLGTYELAGTKYKEIIEINNFNNVKYQFQFGKGITLYIDLGLVLGQVAEFKANLNKDPIYEWELALNQEDFLKTKHNYNQENFKKFCETVAQEIKVITNAYDKEIKRTADRDGEVLVQLVKRISGALYDPTPLLQYYQEEFRALLNEILQDEAFIEAMLPLRALLSSVAEQCVEVIEEMMKLVEKVSVINQNVSNYVECIVSTVTNNVKQSSEAVAAAVERIVDTLLSSYFGFLDSMLLEINKHEKEIRAVTSVISQFTSDMGQLAVSFFTQLKQEYDELVQISLEEIKQTPLFIFLEEKMKQLKNYKFSEGYWPDLQEILKMFAESAPNPELRRFITTLTDNIDQYLTDENMDLEAAVKQVYKEFIASIKPTIDSIYEALSYEESLFNSKFWIPMPWLSLWQTGSSSGGMKLCTIKWLLSGDIPSFIDYTLHSWNSLGRYIPPSKATAYIISGEMITYDGRQVSLADGTYVLAQDLDNRFSIVAEVEKSLLVSIQLTQGSDTVRFTPDGQILMNDVEINYNVKASIGKPGAHFTLSGSALESEESTVICVKDLTMCRLILRAPAFGRVVGVLGTYNYEFFDEYTLPSGKISTNQEEFLNSWRIEEGEEENKPHTHKHNQKCTQMYTSSSQILLCYRLVDPKPFREMCDHVVEKATTEEEKMKALCQSVQHYMRACKIYDLKMSIPPPCDYCEVGADQVPSGEVMSLRPPTDLFDVVFLVELKPDKYDTYEELLIPIAREIKNTLRGDIEFGLIGFGTKDHSNINYFKMDGKLQSNFLPFVTLPWSKLAPRGAEKDGPESNATVIDRLWNVIDHVFIANDEMERGIVRTGVTKSYPWRAGSRRCIVSLVSSPCPLPEPILSPLARMKLTQRLQIMKSYGIVYNLITPVEDIMTTNDNPSDIIGFSKTEAYLLVNDDNENAARERKQDLFYAYDTCHIFPMETGGNVFVRNNLMLESGIVDTVDERVGQLISQSIIRQSPANQCQCSSNHGFNTKFECIVAS